MQNAFDGSTLVHFERLVDDIALDMCLGLQFQQMVRFDRANHGAVDDDMTRLDRAGDLGFLADHEDAGVIGAGDHITLDLAVDAQAVAEAQGRRYGEVSGTRNDLVESKYPDDVDVLGVNIKAGGAGVDLSRAAYGIYFDIGYSLGESAALFSLRAWRDRPDRRRYARPGGDDRCEGADNRSDVGRDHRDGAWRRRGRRSRRGFFCCMSRCGCRTGTFARR